MNNPCTSSRWNLPRRNYSHWAIPQWRPQDRSSSNFDAVPARDGRTTDGQQLPKPPSKFFASKILLTPNCGFLGASYADAVTHCENIFLLLKAEICWNLCVHLPLSMPFHTVEKPFWNEMPRPLICIFHLCPPLNLFNMTQSFSMLTFMLSSKSAQFLGYMDLRTPTIISSRYTGIS